MNSRILGVLVKLRDLNKSLELPFKVAAYNKAIMGIKGVQCPITLANVIGLKKNKIVGDRIYKKIIEFLKTGEIRELAELSEKCRVIIDLLKVKGIGRKFAMALTSRGVTGVRDLKARVINGRIKLTRQQLLGLKHFTDLNTRVPRQIITTFAKAFREHTRGILSAFTVTGSYRRGAVDSGDIDILVTLKGTSSFVNRIREFPGFIDFFGVGKSKVSFLVNLNGTVRQVDVVITPVASYYTALVYFTGSREFNERIRARAKMLGYTLNEWGLVNNKTGITAHPTSENDLFKFLGLPWFEPKDRN